MTLTGGSEVQGNNTIRASIFCDFFFVCISSKLLL